MIKNEVGVFDFSNNDFLDIHFLIKKFSAVNWEN